MEWNAWWNCILGIASSLRKFVMRSDKICVQFLISRIHNYAISDNSLLRHLLVHAKDDRNRYKQCHSHIASQKLAYFFDDARTTCCRSDEDLSLSLRKKT